MSWLGQVHGVKFRRSNVAVKQIYDIFLPSYISASLEREVIILQDAATFACCSLRVQPTMMRDNCL